MRFYILIMLAILLMAQAVARAEDTAQANDLERTLSSAMTDMSANQATHERKIAALRQKRNMTARARADKNAEKKAMEERMRAQAQARANDSAVPYYLRTIPR